MKAESFFTHQRYRWLKLNVVALSIFILLYYVMRPQDGPHGGSLYGYSLGTLATIGILHLMWYGIRRRSYDNSKSTMKGWLSAHVWLGISLLLIVPLHSGFQWGLNVHGAAYGVMILVIVSGIWGAVNYKVLAPQIESHRGGGTMKSLIEQIHIDSKNIQSLCETKSDELLTIRNQIEPTIPPNLWRMISTPPSTAMSDPQLSTRIKNLSASEQEDGFRLVQLCQKKFDLIQRVQREVRSHLKLKAWLLLHLPLSFGLLILVIVHIIVVLLYRS